MSRNLESLDKLSEFPPLSPEEDDSGVNLFFNFFKFGKDRNVEVRDAASSRDITPVSDPGTSKLPTTPTEQKESQIARMQGATSTGLSVLYDDIGVGRSLPNVLKRISNLVALKNTGLQSYKDSDFKQYWMPDSVSKECYDCGDKFTTFRRRHHCRVCGQIFCSRCCKQEISGKILGCTGLKDQFAEESDLRVCAYCGRVVLTYLQSADIGADLSVDLRSLQEDLQHKFGESDSQTSNVPSNSLSPAEKRTRRKYSYQEDRFALGRGSGSVNSSSQFLTSDDLLQCDDPIRSPLQNATQGNTVNTLLDEMRNTDNGLPLQTHQFRHKNHLNCFLGTQLVDWLLSHNKSTTMAEAVGVGQALLERGDIESISQPNDLTFHDGNSLYRLCKVSDNLFRTPSESLQDVNKFSSLPDLDNFSIPSTSSTYYLDLDISENTVQLRRPRQESIKRESNLESSATGADANSTCISKQFLKDTLFAESSTSRELVPSMGWHQVQHLRTDNGEREAYNFLSEAFEKHEDTLLHQLLKADGLNDSWAFSIKPLVHQIVDLVRPDVKNELDFMDIRQYVQFKKVPGGSRSECRMVSGTVFTKQVAHRAMSTKLTNPKILLLSCSIAYERAERSQGKHLKYKYLSLEPMILQERDYLKNVVARIVALEPDIVLVENTVSRLAQEMLLDHQITLVINVKPDVLERLVRLTQADLVKSIDATVTKPSLGMCHTFSVRRFELDNGQSKFLMFFEGCATHLGCTVLLRGGSALELKKLKNIMQHLILVNYSWRREKSFLMDEFAMPPQPALSQSQTDITDDSIKSDVSEEKEVEEGNDDATFLDPLQAPSESPGSPTDPLQQYLEAATSFDEDLLQTSVISLGPPAEGSKFKEALDKTVLSSSPMVSFRVPYLETDEGARSRLRRFFPEHVFWSPILFPEQQTECLVDSNVTLQSSDTPKYVREPHAFVTAKLTQQLDNPEVQGMLAHYRAVGRRLRHPNEPLPPEQIVEKVKSEQSEAEENAPKAQVDALSPYNHQKLAVLFCSFSSESANAPAFCVNPWVVHMELYGKHDIPLGQFLEEYCFRGTYNCPSETCSMPMLRHMRKFVHDGSCIQVTLKQLESQIPVDGNAILMWSWCVICKQNSPVVPLSVDTWTLSFAKYLELRFHCLLYTRRGKESTCSHSLHQHHHQYFGYRDIIATFKHSKVSTWQISLPPAVIQIPSKASEEIQSTSVEEIKQLALKGYEVFSSVVEKLCDIGVEADPVKKEELSKLKSLLNKDNSSFKTKIEDIQIKLTSPRLDETSKSENDMRERLCDIEDSLVYLKRMIAEAVFVWNSRIAEVSKKKDDKSKKSASEISKVPSEGELTRESPSPHLNQTFEGEATEENTSSSEAHLQMSAADSQRAESTPLPNQNSASEELWGNSVENIKKISSLDVGATMQPRRLCYSSIFEKDEEGDSSPTEDNMVTFLEVPEAEASEVQVKGHERSHSEGDSRGPAGASSVLDGPSTKGEKKSNVQNQTSVKQIISQLITSNTYAFTIQSPLGVNEHHLLPLPLGPPVIVNTTEPSSIIAYALSSVDYQKKLSEFKGTTLEVPLASELIASGESVSSTKRTVLSFLRGGSPNLNANRTSSGSRAGDYDSVQFLAASDDNVLEEKPRTSSVISNSQVQESTIDVQFNDYSTTFQCRVYLAEHFSRLRELVCPEGEDSFIRSLASCVQWAARGGKSGSTFCKTKDDRFVLKEMTQNEAQLFLEVAPHYLTYLRKSLESGQPTLLGKIVGAFRVSHRGLNSSASNKTHLLVMENLFYGRTVAQRFDLKGSLRNRLVDTSGTNAHGEEIVLLDENLIKMSCEAPLYVLPHCKMVLTLAIERDTQFLASQGVMDYSLLVGLDEQRKELVLGIIDYVRLFTWDKKIETMVKSSGILGGQGKMPTIVNPEVYRARFMAAMHRYFLPVPDRWTGLGSGVES